MRWFFSGKGDEGKSSLMDGVSLAKNDAAFELIGTLDELNAAIGLAISFCGDETTLTDLNHLQKTISGLMGVIAGYPLSADDSQAGLAEILTWVEERITYYGGDINNPQQFVFSGKTSLGAALDLSRTIVRRAERRAVDYRETHSEMDKNFSAILNRLSSLLFLMRLFVDNL
jgi:cob(I)alamin adenosyltransferase